MGTATVLWDAAWCEDPAPSAGVPPAPPVWAAGLGAQQAADPPCNEFGEFPAGPKYLISHLGPFPSLFSRVLTTTACSEAPPAGQGLPRGFSGVCLGPNPTCTQAAPRSELGLTGLYGMSVGSALLSVWLELAPHLNNGEYMQKYILSQDVDLG